MTRQGRLSVVFACFSGVLLGACGRVDYEWQGPTDNFRGLDANSDGAVDRFEWEQKQGSTFAATRGFRCADSNSDGRMSWHEYFVGYLHSKRCPDALYEPPPPPPLTSDSDVTYAYPDADEWPNNWLQGTLLVRPEENLQIYERQPEGPDVPTLLRPILRPPPEPYSEEDMPAGVQQRIHFTSGKLADLTLVAHYDPTEKIPGNEDRADFPHLSCEITNDNDRVRITMADIEVVWHSNRRESRGRWIKPVWIEPGRSQHLDVWFGSAVEDAECHLLHVRGQRLSKIGQAAIPRTG